jgi:hypothetical protein
VRQARVDRTLLDENAGGERNLRRGRTTKRGRALPDHSTARAPQETRVQGLRFSQQVFEQVSEVHRKVMVGERSGVQRRRVKTSRSRQRTKRGDTTNTVLARAASTKATASMRGTSHDTNVAGHGFLGL